MTRLIKLDKDLTIKIAKKMEEFLTPDFVYIPFPPKKEDLKKEKLIKKGSKIYLDVYSPISGKLTKIEKCLLPNGKEVNCLVLANDYQEKMVQILPTRRKINNLSKETILKDIYNTRLKEKLKKENVTTFIISGIDDEPYIENESFYQIKKVKEIVDTIEALLNIFSNAKVWIAVKNTDSETIVKYQTILGMYKNIELKLVEDLYLIGKEEFLTKYLHIKEPYIYLKTSEVYEIYRNIKKRRPVLERFITISGNGISKPILVKAKIGVKVIDILYQLCCEDYSDCTLFVNGMMQGKRMDISRLIVTPDLEGIIIMKKEKRIPKKCIKCGKCISICPIRSNPLMAYKLGMNVKCIHCGLCSYICPSYIPLQKYLNGDDYE